MSVWFGSHRFRLALHLLIVVGHNIAITFFCVTVSERYKHNAKFVCVFCSPKCGCVCVCFYIHWYYFQFSVTVLSSWKNRPAERSVVIKKRRFASNFILTKTEKETLENCSLFDLVRRKWNDRRRSSHMKKTIKKKDPTFPLTLSSCGIVHHCSASTFMLVVFHCSSLACVDLMDFVRNFMQSLILCCRASVSSSLLNRRRCPSFSFIYFLGRPSTEITHPKQN